MRLKYAALILQALYYSAKADCFDGRNFGCSHICSGSVCECPPCWTLRDDGKTCEFESGKVQVTCTETDAEITLDKCTVPGVDASKIHLRDTSCTAVQENENSWKLTTDFSSCGSTLGFSDEKIHLQNTIFIGHSIIDGRRRGREFEIDFSCSYSQLTTAVVSTSVQASDTKFGGLTFDINSGQPMDLEFGFLLQFYRSSNFEALVTTGTFQPGSPLFGEVASATSLPEELAFSVTKCKAEDKAISQALDFLDTCPVEGINFQFYPGQSASSKVQFSFESFVFQESADDATIDVSCDIQICPQTSVECFKLCDSDAAMPTPTSTTIMVILPVLSDSYIINGDGSTEKAVKIRAPSNDYTYNAKSAVVADELYFFGGNDNQKIARLESCTIVELTVKLNNVFADGHAALASADNSQALICFGSNSPNNYCDIFDGSNVVTTFSTTYNHFYGGLGYYNGQPTTVGSQSQLTDAYVETLSQNGWTTLTEFPTNVRRHSLVGLENGDMLLIGGYDGAYQPKVWRLSSNLWTEEATLQKTVTGGSAIKLHNQIYSFAGLGESHPIQRLDLAGDGTVDRIELIGNHDKTIWEPVLYIVDANTCTNN